jgi:hypothetical protein
MQFFVGVSFRPLIAHVIFSAGMIPVTIGNCIQLKELWLQDNQFSGKRLVFHSTWHIFAATIDTFSQRTCLDRFHSPVHREMQELAKAVFNRQQSHG